MKLKRILAGIIACTMVATAMGVTAFAADTEPTDVVTTTETETEILAGDINNDDVVDLKDALTLSKYLVAGDDDAKAAFAELMELNLDAVRDEDGYIGIASIINILKEVIKTPPVTETTPEETETTPEETEDPELVESAKADLADAIEIAEVERLNEDYTEDSWLALDAALKAAKAVSEDATIAEIVAATEALTAAIEGLVTEEEELANAVSALRDTLAVANEKVDAEDEEDPYTYDSLIELEAAIDDAVDILYDFDNDLDVAIEDVIAATDNLNAAIANIKTDSQELKEAGNALKADIAVANDYITLARTVGEVADDKDSALEVAIADAEALFTRTGRLNADSTIDMVLDASDDLVDSLEAVVNNAWTKTITAEDGSIVLEKLDEQVSLAVELGLYTYEDVFALTGLVLTEAQADALADLEEDEVDGFYMGLLIENNAINADSVTGLSNIYEAFNAKVSTVAKTATANAKKAYDDAFDLASDTKKFTVESIDILITALEEEALANQYYDLDDSIIDALKLNKAVKAETDKLVTNASAEAAEAAFELVAALEDEYADFIVIDDVTDKISFNADSDYEVSKIINPALKRTLLNNIQAAYDSILEGTVDVDAEAINTSAQDVDATSLNAATKSLTAALLDARKACYEGIKAEYDAFDAGLTTTEKGIADVKAARQVVTDLVKGINSRTTADVYKEVTNDIKTTYTVTIPAAIQAELDLIAAIGALEALIDEAKEKDNTDEIYDEADWEAFTDALEAAEALDLTDATIAEVTEATTTLTTAMNNLLTEDEKDEAAALEAAIDALEAVINAAPDKDGYTVDTTDFETALNAANAALESDDIEVVNGAKTALETAITDLNDAQEAKNQADADAAELAEAIVLLNAEIDAAELLIAENEEDGDAVKALKTTLATAVEVAEATVLTDKTVVEAATTTLTSAITAFTTDLDEAVATDEATAAEEALATAKSDYATYFETFVEADYTTDSWALFIATEAYSVDVTTMTELSDVTDALTALEAAALVLVEVTPEP